jgi:hypothetical protein
MGLGAPRPPGQGWPAESPTVPDPPNAPDPPDAPATPHEPGAPATPHEPGAPDPCEALDEPDEPDPDWPDDWADNWADEEAAAPPGMTGPPPGPGRTGGPPRRPRLRPLAVAAVAVAALAMGAGVALAVTKGLSPAPAAANRSSPPSAAAPSIGAPGSNGGGGALPGSGTGGTAGTEQIFVGGQVLAVSDTSITIGGPDRKITAAVTRSTRFTGRVDGIQGVKDGDLVTAQIAQSGGTATVVALQDPGELP